jgi:hypothetical protein
MKRMALVLMAVLIALSVALSGSDTPKRQVHGYKHVRPGGVTANDAALTATTSTWGDIDDWVEIPEDWDSLSLSIYAYGDGSGAGDPHGAVFDANLYVAHEFGSALHACRFHGEIGNLQMSHDPAFGPGSQYAYAGGAADLNHKWAEGPFQLVESFWRTPVGMSGKVDGVGELNINHNGATKIKVLFDNTADATQWFCVMTGRRR